MSKHYRQADRFQQFAEELNCHVDRHRAQTKTIYLTVNNDDGEEIKIRFADHADAYGTSWYSVDPAEGTMQGLRARFLKWIGLTEKDVRAMRKARREDMRHRVDVIVTRVMEMTSWEQLQKELKLAKAVVGESEFARAYAEELQHRVNERARQGAPFAMDVDLYNDKGHLVKTIKGELE